MYKNICELRNKIEQRNTYVVFQSVRTHKQTFITAITVSGSGGAQWLNKHSVSTRRKL